MLPGMNQASRIHLTLTGRQTGLTLTDVLIALLVLSVGLLGLAMLQTHALRASNTAQMLYIASNLARDMAERMYGSPAAAAQGKYNYSAGMKPDTGYADLDDWLERVARNPEVRATALPCSVALGAGACAQPAGYVVSLSSQQERDSGMTATGCTPGRKPPGCVRFYIGPVS